MRCFCLTVVATGIQTSAALGNIYKINRSEWVMFEQCVEETGPATELATHGVLKTLTGNYHQ